MSGAGPGDGSSGVSWKVLAWTVGTLITVAGLALGVVQYIESQREPMKQVCARADDVTSSLATVLRARINGLDASAIDFDALHEEARELNGKANDTDSEDVRRAASSLRQHLELLTADTYRSAMAGGADTTAGRALLKGAGGLAVIRAECKRQGFQVSEFPRDLVEALQKVLQGA